MNVRSTSDKIAIAGGGLGGLACALALAQRGFSVIVLEQAQEFGEAGVGLQVAPNALHVLDALGVKSAAIHQALIIERWLFRDAISGEIIADIPCGEPLAHRFGNLYALAHRADVHGALLKACRAFPQLELRTSARVADYGLDGKGVSVLLASGERVSAAALVGADGIHSAVRQHIVKDGDPTPSGAKVYRAVIPAEQMPKEMQHPYPLLWGGPGLHIIYYPMRDWKVFNFGATVVTGETSVDEDNDAPPEEPLELCASSCEAALRVMQVPKSFRRFMISHRQPVENWSDGPVTLLGDAAHPMVQYLAQGAAMALEDAICLAVTVEEADGDYISAFQHYQAKRIVRSARVQLSSLAMDRILHAKGVERLVRNDLFAGRTMAEHYKRFAWLYTQPNYVRPATQ